MSTKVWLLAPNENWIVDRFVKEWSEDNSDITTTNIEEATVIWALADWCFNQIPQHILLKKQKGLVKIVTTVHHIVPDKFSDADRQNFLIRDLFTDLYHVYNVRTEKFIKSLTKKPIKLIPYWANQNLFFKSKQTKQELREKYNLPLDAYLVGSFQRDTEGAGIQNNIFLPKLEKGPDLLCKTINELHYINNNVQVLLSGWRRQYVINQLDNLLKIKYHYIELPSQDIINELYQTLDLYIVTARHEGGPQALIECGLCGVPVISSYVGIAEQVLPQTAINNHTHNATPTIPIVESMLLPQGYIPYRDLFESL